MEETKKKIDSKALAGTIIFHAVLLLCFLFFGLSTPLPLPEEEGVLVNLGYTNQGMGQRQPLTASPPPPQPQPAQSSRPAEQIATQNTEESIALPDSRREEPQRQQRENTQQPRPQPQPAQETVQQQPQPEPQPQVDQRALFPGRDRRTTESQNQGETGQPGNQGRPDGSTDGTSFTGGGQGSGVDFSLTGRRANYLPIPDYTSQAQGRVVVAITVNRNGEVIRVSAGARGTTTSDQTLWRLAEDAARRARFDVKNDAPHEQTGTITYNFIRLN
jgi:colicin import membrane protein